MKILKKGKIAEGTYLMQIHAPEIAKAIHPGQFVMAYTKNSEHIPFHVADYTKTTITIIFKVRGKTTADFAKLKKASQIEIVGPFGNPSPIKNYGNVIVIGQDYGMAATLLLAKELKKAGNKVVTVLCAKNKKELFWEKEIKKAGDKIIIATEDGSAGIKGGVVEGLIPVFRRLKINFLYGIGPLTAMKQVAKYTHHRTRALVSVHAPMLDGMGISGSDRVRCEGEIKFASVDGPCFDAHQIDFEELLNREQQYAQEQKLLCRRNKVKV